MPLQIAPVAAHGNKLFDQLPEDMVVLIFEKLKEESGSIISTLQNGDQTIMATEMVCKNWQNNPFLRREREEASTRLRQRENLQKVHLEMRELNEYPLGMVRAFRNSRTPISQLPVLDLGNRMGGAGYIDFIQPADMTQSVMRFRDRFGRPGIALKIHASQRITLQLRLDQLRQEASYTRYELQRGNLFSLLHLARVTTACTIRFFRESGHDVVLAPFKRYSDPESTTWAYGWGDNDPTIEHLYIEKHNQNSHQGEAGGIIDCPNCPFVDNTIHPTVFSDLLTSRDPDLFLPGHNVMRPGNQVGERSLRVSQRTIVITALAVLMIAYLMSYTIKK